MSIDIDMERSYPTPFRNSTLFPLLLVALATQKHTPDTKTNFRQTYDYIVVGSGSAGSVVASRLSDDPRKTVLLLEAGKSPPLLTELPAAQPYFIGSDIFWNFVTEPQQFAALRHVDRKVPCSTAKVVGGSSTDNNMFYIRGNHADYDSWKRDGAVGWSTRDVFEYFLKPENNTDPDIANNGYHSVGGPLTIGRYRYNSELKLQLSKAAAAMGYPFHDINGARQTGFADTQGSIRKGQRCSTAKAYLVPRQRRRNLHIVVNGFVTKILIQDHTAKGVRFDFRDATYEIEATREVIICAGALNTPKLLMLSGIGPRQTLEKFGIPVKANLPVGENYHDPAATSVNFVSTKKRPTFEEKLKDDNNILQYIYNRTGPLAGMLGNFGLAFLTDDPVAERRDLPDYQLFFLEGSFGNSSPYGLSQDVYDRVFGPYINKPAIICASQDPSPRSRGYVTIGSTNPYDPPKINPNYYQDPDDLRRIVAGMKACYRIMRSSYMKVLGYKPFETRMPGCAGFLDSDEYLKCYAQSLLLPAYHQAGTARMGDIRDPRVVVDPQLRVKGMKRLRVVDGSVIPSLPRGGTNNPVIMIAEKVSDIIIKEHY